MGLGQSVPAPDDDWWNEESDARAQRAVQKFIDDVVKSTEESAVDFVATAYNGRNVIVLVGESHEDSAWKPEKALEELDQSIEGKASRYTETLATYDASSDAMCSTRDAPSARVCRHGGARKVDPRTPVLYEFWDHMTRKQPVEFNDLEFYKDIMTLYFNAVRATVKANIVRMHDDQQAALIETLMNDFTNGVARIRNSFHEARSAADIRSINIGELAHGLDVVLMSDILYRDRQVNVVFSGSAHARHLVDRLTEDGGTRVTVFRDEEV